MGLLLLANLDKAFDLGFVSFTGTGRVMISSQLEAPEVLGLQEGMAFAVQHEHKTYLDYHRGVLFRGKGDCLYHLNNQNRSLYW